MYIDWISSLESKGQWFQVTEQSRQLGTRKVWTLSSILVSKFFYNIDMSFQTRFCLTFPLLHGRGRDILPSHVVSLELNVTWLGSTLAIRLRKSSSPYISDLSSMILPFLFLVFTHWWYGNGVQRVFNIPWDKEDLEMTSVLSPDNWPYLCQANL